jgi:hypothetical protein
MDMRRTLSVTLIDTNVVFDVVTDDKDWADWSIRPLDAAPLRGPLAIDDVVYAALSGAFCHNRIA